MASPTALCLAQASESERVQKTPAANQEVLQPGKRVMVSGRVKQREFGFAAPKGTYVQFLVDQRGHDVVLKILDDQNNVLYSIDRPNGSWGPEHLGFVATTEGTLRLIIKSREISVPQPEYSVFMYPPRKPTTADELRAATERDENHAEQLRVGQSFASLNEAIGLYRSVIKRWQRLREPYEEAVAEYGLGWSYRDLAGKAMVKRPAPLDQIRWIYDSSAELGEATNAFNRARRLFARVGSSYDMATIYLALGWPLLYQGRYAEAGGFFHRAAVLHKRAGNLLGEAFAIYAEGWTSLAAGQYQQALQQFLLSLQLRGVSTEQQVGTANTDEALGRTYAVLGDPKQAIDYASKALKLYEDLHDVHGQGSSLSVLGSVYEMSGQYGDALACYRKAVLKRQEDGDLTGTTEALFDLAQVLRQQGNLVEARKLLDEIEHMIEPVRTRSSNFDLRAAYFAQVQDYFEFYIDLLMNSKTADDPADDESAWAIHERSRARTLLDLLTEAHIDYRGRIDEAAAVREKELQQDFRSREKDLLRAVGRRESAEKLDSARKNEEEAATKYADLLEQIREKNPGSAGISPPEIVSLSDAQSLLDEDTALLDFSIGSQQGFAWVITPHEITSYKIPGRAAINSMVKRLLELVIKTGQGSRADAEFRQVSRECSRQLVGPAQKALERKRLLIVPDGALHYLPFAALPDPRDADNDAPRYLIAQHEIVSIPSLSVLRFLRRERKINPASQPSLLALADPAFGPQSRVPALPFTRKEAKAIGALFPRSSREILVGTLASKQLAMSEMPSRFSLVHFATHGYFDNEHPERAGLVFALISQNGKPVDGYLRLKDIFRMKLSADLVVLSACESGGGEELRGEGLIGMTRGFISSGARSLVTSLWTVNDLGGSEIMEPFYRSLLDAARQNPAGALREAQLAMLRTKRWNAPRYWAGFTVTGDWK